MIDWSKFQFEFTLRKQFVAELVGIEGRRRGISSWVLPYPWVAHLENKRRIRSIVSTLELDGTTISEQRVTELLDDAFGSPSQTFASPEVQAMDLAHAFSSLKEQFDHNSRQKLSLETILDLHKLTTSSISDQYNVPGRFRNYEVAVDGNTATGRHRSAPTDTLSSVMGNFVAWIDSDELSNRIHPIVRALIAHFFLVTIRPFGNGNDRVSRLLETGLLYNAGVDVPGFFGLNAYYWQNKLDYHRHLQSAWKSAPFDLTEFVAFGLRGMRRDLEEILSYIRSRLSQVLYRRMLDEALHKRISERRMLLNEREYNLLSYLLRSTESQEILANQRSHRIKLLELLDDPLTTALYKGKTRRTIQRELDRLEKNGFIQFEKRDGEIFVAIDYDAIGKY